jgi:hypothetical protein
MPPETQAAPLQQVVNPQPIYTGQSNLIQALDYFLAAPSIPLALKQEFHVMWENVVFGNYDAFDILLLESKFREWCILLKWYIPDQQWGNSLVFEDVQGSRIKEMKLDLSMLITMLQMEFHINLTRGKGGFTVKEMTTTRLFSRQESTEQEKKKGWRLF